MIVTPSTTTAPLSTAMLLAYDKMPDSVTADINQIGGWLVFVVDFLAGIHLVYLGASLALLHFSDRQLPIPAGQWFAKIIFAIWICAIAGTLSAVVIGA